MTVPRPANAEAAPSLIGRLAERAAREPDRPAFAFLDRGEVESARWTFGELDRRVDVAAASISDVCSPGDRALLLHPPGVEFVAAFFGCLRAGVVAVPAYPPRSERMLPRLRSIVEDCLPTAALTTRRALPHVQARAAADPGLGALRWAFTDGVAARARPWPPDAAPGPDDVAFLQYTSGSTAAPKGVEVRHRNLMHNLEVIREARGAADRSVFVSWLPIYHDLGLIGQVLQAVYNGDLCVLMAPVAFLQRPARWLEAISRYRADASGGPDFAYDLCVQKAGELDRRRVDLSCWRIAFNGAEPVRASTLDRFVTAFEPLGFRREAFLPCYGLAESTLMVSGAGPEELPVVAKLAADALEEGRAVTSRNAASGRRTLVACGRPLGGARVEIVDPELGRRLPVGRVGEIWVSSPSVAAGYWGRAEATAETFGARLPGVADPFLRTGDLGFFHRGELYVAGRLKDLIILRGRNHYPQDLELTAGGSHPACVAGGSVAFSVEEGGAERLVLVQEVHRGSVPDPEELVAAVRQAVALEHEVRVARVVLVRTGGVPRTSSGKVQRRRCRELLARGELPILEPERSEARVTVFEGRHDLESAVRALVARLAGVDAAAVDPAAPLAALGLDSLAAIDLAREVEARFGVSIPITLVLEGASARDVVERLAVALDPRRAPVEPPAQARSAGASGVPPSDAGGEALPLSWGQRSLWFLHRLAPESTAYHLVGAARLPTGVDPPRLRRALQALVDRHPALRTTFPEGPDGPVQRVHERSEVAFRSEDASSWSEAELDRRLREEADRPFDLERGPVFRSVLFLRGADTRLVLGLHHVAADFWSLGLLVRQLGDLYAGTEPETVAAVRSSPPVENAAEEERLLAYWRRRLTAAPPLDLPSDRPRPAVQTYRGSSRVRHLAPGLAGRVREVAAAGAQTPFTLLLAAWASLLARLSGQCDLVVGTPTAGRAAPEHAALVGYLVNPIALRFELADDPGAGAWVERVRRRVLEGLEHAALPFARLAERLHPERDPSRPPVFQALFGLQRAPAAELQTLAAFALGIGGMRLEVGGLLLESVPLRRSGAQLDLSLLAAEIEGGLAVSAEYNVDLFDATTVDRILHAYEVHLEALVAALSEGSPGVSPSLSGLPLLSRAEMHQVTTEWASGRAAAGDSYETLADLLLARVALEPDAVAVDADELVLSYGELHRRAEALAARLADLGVGPEVAVGVHLGRSPALVIAVLAVVHSGGVYVPLDPELPAQRLATMVAGAEPSVILADPAAEPPDAGSAVLLFIDRAGRSVSGPGEPPADAPAPAMPPAARRLALAYTLFTSGSTGGPKAVGVPFEGLLNRLLRAQEAHQLGPGDAVLQKAPIVFDFSLWELLGPLVAGARVVLARTGGQADPAYLLDLVPRRRVTLLHCVPSLWEALAGATTEDGGLATWRGTLRQAFSGGEALSADLAERVAAATGAPLENQYGPTEASIDVLWQPVEGREGRPAVALGRPLAGGSVRLLGPDLSPCPIGVAGELCIGGAPLARGYAARPGPTAERFVPEPASGGGSGPGARLYRTGDHARFLADGRVEFLGRLDRQVKVRGVRIEPAEVEALLLSHPGVRAAAVVAVQARAGELSLAALWVPGASPPSPETLRDHLVRRLSRVMVPTLWLPVDELPRTASGKLDRRGLERAAAASKTAEDGAVALRTPLEELIAGVWADLLGVETVGPEDDFFALGGHSLLATQVVSRLARALGVGLQVSALFETPTVSGLARRVSGLRAEGPGVGLVPPALAARRDDGPAPLSFAQERLWFLERFQPGHPVYNMPAALAIEGPLDPRALRRSLEAVVHRHDALRTRFREVDGAPVQEVAPPAWVPLPVIDLRSVAGERRAAEGLAEHLAREEALRPFDVAAGPPLRLRLIRLGPGDHRLLVTLHHFVADGWSVGVLVRELAAAYRAAMSGGEPRLAAPPVQYPDFAAWQREWLAGPVFERELDLWKESIAGAPAILELPLDRPRPPLRSWRGAAEPVCLDAEVSNALRGLGRSEGVTPFMVLLAAFEALLERWTGADDGYLGVPVANRRPVDVEGSIGLFVNLLVLRMDLAGEPTWRELLDRVRGRALAAFDRQDLPFEKVVEALGPERSPAYPPLVQVTFAVERSNLTHVELGSLGVRPLPAAARTAKFDLSVTIEDTGGAFVGEIEYCRDLFEPATVRRLANQYAALAADLAGGPGRRVSRAGLLRPGERHQLLYEWAEAAAAGDPHGPRAEVADRLAEWFAATPDAVALSWTGGAMTYGALDLRSRVLARRLAGLGAGSEGPVALLTGRSPELVVAALATLRAGGIYLPLDPSDPPARLAAELEDAAPVAVLVRAGGEEVSVPARWPRLQLDAAAREAGDGGPPLPRPALSHPGRLAYLIYTSGSTGAPKAVAVTHGGLSNLVAWHSGTYRPGPRDTATLIAGPGFDASVWEVWSSLCAGASLHVVPEDARTSPERLLDLFAERRVSVAFVPTPLAEGVLSALETVDSGAGASSLGWHGALRVLLTGGDRLHRPPARELPFLLVNHYGPTEATVVTTAGGVGTGSRTPPAIGRPIPGLRAHLLDRRFRTVPVGAYGELCIGGRGLARGYRGLPGPTAERFVPDRHAATPGARLYRSGDLARRLPGGELEFVRRLDDQVKIRGLRVELGEIEALLAAHPTVRQAVVAPPAPGCPLRAYVVPAPGMAADPSELARHLGARLPSALVPARFVVLSALPVTPSGKVDRRALPALEPEAAEAAPVPPRGPLEDLVASVWADALGLDRIGVHDDFFALGGHSLLATRILGRLSSTTGRGIGVRELFENPTVAGVAAALERSRASTRTPRPEPPLVAIPRDRPLPASFAQERLWFLDRLEPGTTSYNLPACLHLEGVLDAPALGAALLAAAGRHESLRTRFLEIDGAPFQQATTAGAVALPVIDLSALPEDVRDGEGERLARADAHRPFDLERGPVFRAALVRLGERRHAALVSTHHAVADGWSLAVFLRDLGAFYEEAAGGPAARLPRLRVQYADFAAWQRLRLTDEVLAEEIAHWRERLDGAALLELPADRPRPKGPLRGGLRRVTVDAALADAVRRLARLGGATPFMVLLAAFRALLARHAGQDDFALGTPVAGRSLPELEDVVGFFVNTLALRTPLTGDPSFAELVSREREACLEAFAHREMPFARLVESLAPDRKASPAPLVDVLFGLQNLPPVPPRLARGVALRVAGGAGREAKLPLVLLLTEEGGGLAGTLEFAADLFDPTTAERLLDRFRTLLRAAVEAPGARVSALALLPEAERRQVLEEWNRTAVPGRRGATVHDLFRARAEATPDAVAVELGGESLSYGELDRRSARAGARLRARLSSSRAPRPNREHRVGLLVPRSIDLVVAILGVLRAGAAYLPLSPNDPPERLRLVLRDAGCRWVIAPAGPAAAACLGGSGGIVGLTVAELAAPPSPEETAPPFAAAGPEALAYVMYTSGSTGRPKGVEVPHRAVVRLVCGAEYARFGPEQTFLQLAPISFDASTFELWGPLLHGGRLTVMPPGPASLSEVGREIAARRVTTLWLTAGLFHQLVEGELAFDPAPFRGLRQLLAGGDALSPEAVRRAVAALPDTVLVNGYGPTEGTTFTCCQTLSPAVRGAEATRGWVPIGTPIANTRAFVVDRSLQPVPPGVAGELVAGGQGLARGYLGRPSLTAERFVPDPFGGAGDAGTRLYRTGDRVRRREGVLQFLGRLDRQVKLRGFRVEPGEVEAALVRHPAVAQAAVVVVSGDADGPRLVACLVPVEEGELDRAALRAHLAAELPAYMVPTGFRALPELPLTPNGKPDRERLATLAAGPPDGEAEPLPTVGDVSPAEPIQEIVAGMWGELLGLERVGVRQDFFELGGHSLLATRLVSRLREVFGVEISLAAFFDLPTVEAVAAAVERLRTGAAAAGPALRPRSRTGPGPLSFAQERLWFLDRLEPRNPAYNVPAAVRLSGDLDRAAFVRSLRAVVARHEVLRTRFRERDGQAVQEVLTARRPPAVVVDLGGLAPARAEEAASAIARGEAGRGFDLVADPLLRLVLLRLGEGEHMAVLTVHHVVTDGWSTGVLVRELAAFYLAFRRGSEAGGAALPALPIQYADYAAWQRDRLDGAALAAEVEHWRRRLAGAAKVLELPLDRPRPVARKLRGRHLPLRLGAELTSGLESLGRRRGATQFMTLLAVFVALLHRYTGERDLLVGAPIANRGYRELEALIGFFANTLVLRARPAPLRSFAELLAELRDEALTAYDHQELPFEKLVEELRPERTLAHSPLVQVMLALEITPRQELVLPGLELRPEPVVAQAAKLDLTVYLRPAAGGLEGGLEYDPDLFDETTVRRMARHLLTLAASALARPDAPLADLDLTLPAERHQIASWSDTDAPLAAGASVPGWLTERCRRTPDAVAVVAGDGGALSYGALLERATRLAGRLRELGVAPEDRVVVLLDRSLELPVAILATLFAGAAYVPLDAEEPAARLAGLAEAAGARVAISTSELRERLGGWEGVLLAPDGGPEAGAALTVDPPASGAALAYVLHTSGSTGRPKGVQVGHAALANQVRWFLRAHPVSPVDRLLQKTSLAFDASVWEFFVPLAAGAALVLARPGEQREPGRLARTVARERITLLQAVPSFWRALLEDGRLAAECGSLRAVFSGGEALPGDLEEALADRLGARVVNLYGPAEATVQVTSRVRGAGPVRRVTPLGRPVDNAQIEVVGPALAACPVGVPGELCIAGLPLARGYLARPGLTAERFVPAPGARGPGTRRYRTGDRARWLPDGSLEYLGRLDRQVKVRGQRVEPGEVEAALREHPRISDAAVVPPEEAGAGLRAYVVLHGAEGAATAEVAAELRPFLERRLPRAMVPGDIVLLDQLPVLVSGKLDRSRLPAPVRVAGETAQVAPRNEVEAFLAVTVEEILERGPVGIHDDFFSLGGHSLQAIRLLSKVRGAFGVELEVRILFEAPTVAGLAVRIAEALVALADPDEVAAALADLEREPLGKR